MTPDFNQPVRPIDNAFVESFNGRLREECLNAHWFLSLLTWTRWWMGADTSGPMSALSDLIETHNRIVNTDFETHRAAVLNVIPPQRAGVNSTEAMPENWTVIAGAADETLLLREIRNGRRDFPRAVVDQ